MRLSLPYRSFSLINTTSGLRGRTLMGTQFKVIERPVTAEKAADGLAKTHYYLAETQSNDLMSPWHDI